MGHSVASLEKRITRIEKELFPENIKKLFDYTLRCKDHLCICRPIYIHNSAEIKDYKPNTVCSYCGGIGKIIEDIYEHEEVVFK